MKKFKMAIMSVLMTTCMVVTPTAPVSASNVTDSGYYIHVNSSSSSFATVDTRAKQDSTKVYVYITESPTKYTQIRVYGNRNTDIFYNETKGGLAKVLRNQKSSITNSIYENRKSGYSSVTAKLGLRSNSSKTGYVEGVWSPDSTRNYTVVN